MSFVEVVAESCFADPRALREAQALVEIWPVVPHGVKLSLASGGGLDTERARRLGGLARSLRAPVVSEHIALTRGGGREIGHLTAVPFTRETVSTVARNVNALRRHLQGVPLLLENIAWTFRYPEDEMDEGTFHAEIAEATGCDLLLDLANLYANAVNSGVEPETLLGRYPLERVGMVHVAGGVLEDDGFYVDTHAHAVPAPVHTLLERSRPAWGDCLLLGGTTIPAGRRARRARSRRSKPAGWRPAARSARRDPGFRPTASVSSGAREAEVARLLTEPTLPEGTCGLDRTALVRPAASSSTNVSTKLCRSFPPRRARDGPGMAFRALAGTPRPLRFAASRTPAIAKLAAGRSRRQARRRRRGGRARALPRGSRRRAPRRGPGLAARRLPSGGAAVAWKGPGGSARVHTISFPGKEVS
jgi:hypothetical protein